ncbi:MAG: DUF4082 domain-containing protein [Actinomycetes bacterium]
MTIFGKDVSRFTQSTKLRLRALLVVAVLSPLVFVGLSSTSAPAGAVAAPQTIFGSDKPTNGSDTDNQSVEVGTRFTVVTSGTISAIRYWKSSANTGPHTGALWTNAGAKLASVTFVNETESGWQTANLSKAITVKAGLKYVVSYHTNVGHYAADAGYFDGKGAGAGDVKATANATTSANGIYRYGASGFPKSTWHSSNYWVDVVFNASSTTAAPSATTSTTSTSTAPTTSTTAAPTTTTTAMPVTTTTTPTAGPSALSGEVPCALNGAAEACWASHTGVPGVTEAQILAGNSSLRHVTGDLTITTDGTVISDTWLDGCISVKAKNVTIQRVLVHTLNRCRGGDGADAGGAIDTGQNEAITTNLQIIDTTIDGMNEPVDRAGVSGSGWSCLRCNVFGFSKDMIPIVHVTVTDSYLHDITPNAGAAHTNVFFFFGGGQVKLAHSFVKASGGGGYMTSAISILGTYAGAGVTIDRNYAEGVTSADIGPAGGSIVNQVVVTNNALSPNNGWGGTAFANHFDASKSDNVWTNNYNSETMAIIGAPSV